MSSRRIASLVLDYAPVVVVWLGAANILLRRPLFDHESNVVGSALLAIVMMGFTWFLSYMASGRFCASHWPPLKVFWSLGFLSLLLHIVIAFHISHNWSHSDAVEHVRRVGGFGGGIIVNYVFASVWLADVVWWWASPTSHGNRPRWVTWSIHGFLLFVVVNSTVVFGAEDRRWGYAFGLLFFPLLAIATRWAIRRSGKRHRPDLMVVDANREAHSPT